MAGTTCRRCGRPIIFLTEEPRYYNAGTFVEPREALTEPRAVPIDPDPSPSGSIAIYEVPSRSSPYPAFRDFRGKRMSYIRYIYPPATSYYLRYGGALYRSHFDTCPRSQPPPRR